MNKNKFYVTTPIYYVTAAPHLGSLYSTLLADVFARYHKIAGNDVFFLTGTDEHGQKIAQAAELVGKDPKTFVDGFIDSYKDMWHLYDIDYSKFIRTTDTYHVTAVQEWIKQLMQKGDIYKDFYTGWYCTPCETFVASKDQEINESKEILCASCGRSTVEVSEECYFFRLSAYQDKLLEFFKKHSDFITPKERLQEVISFVKEGLKDLSISRKTVTWGIPFPGDTDHVTYVWADALNNYITAIGYGQKDKQEEFSYWWPADLQILGKDIVRFHAIYWPAFLMASGLELPKKLLVHGWIKVDDQKMSKSKGNAVDPQKLANEYGVDQMRYYMTRKLAVTQDSEFRLSDIEQSINSELANDLGNLLNRCVLFAAKKEMLTIRGPFDWSKQSRYVQDQCKLMIDEAYALVQEGFLHRAIARVWEFVNQVNAYFHEQEPWKKTDERQVQEVIAATVYSLQAIGIMLWPVMPKTMEKMLASLGITFSLQEHLIDNIKADAWNEPLHIQKIDTLFKKHEIKTEVIVEEKKQEQAVVDNTIGFEDFVKVDMRVGKIVQAEEVEGSDKLLKLQVDLGELGNRQILAGVKKHFGPNDLINQLGVFVVNLKPRKMMGMLSEGMMLAVSDENGLHRVIPSGDVKPGSRVS